MNTFQMEAFLAIARNLSYSAAAKELFVSQSSLSKTIMALEEELNVTLFARKGNKIGLTDAGKIVVEYFEYFVEDQRQMLAKLKQYANSRSHFLSIGMSRSMSSSRLLAPISAYQKQHPQVSIQIIQTGHLSYLEKLDSHEVDLVVGWLEKDLGGGYDVRIMATDYWRLLVPMDSPLAGHEDEVNLILARDENFIVPADEESYRKFTAICNENGFKPRIKHRISNIDGSMELVAAGMGVMFCSYYMVPKYFSKKTKLLVINPKLPNNLVLISRANEGSPLLQDFCAFFQEQWKAELAEDSGWAQGDAVHNPPPLP